MEREVGGGIGMGNTCKPMAVLFQCMTKFTTNKKKKKKRKVTLSKYTRNLWAVPLPVSEMTTALGNRNGIGYRSIS